MIVRPFRSHLCCDDDADTVPVPSFIVEVEFAVFVPSFVVEDAEDEEDADAVPCLLSVAVAVAEGGVAVTKAVVAVAGAAVAVAAAGVDVTSVVADARDDDAD